MAKKIELKKVNEPTGEYWYGIWVDGSCTSPSYGKDLDKARIAYDAILELHKNPLPPPYEVIESTEI